MFTTFGHFLVLFFVASFWIFVKENHVGLKLEVAVFNKYERQSKSDRTWADPEFMFLAPPAHSAEVGGSGSGSVERVATSLGTITLHAGYNKRAVSVQTDHRYSNTVLTVIQYKTD